MQNFYNQDIILKILRTFKIDTIIISGISDSSLINLIHKHDASITKINTNDSNCIKENPLNVLPNLENYDAIFINDDANWYTVFNELNIIKNTNKEFPLVFICNNKFPNKRRDSYSNPDYIPDKFRKKYTKKLPICYGNEKIIISDGFYHACEENTPKNGVLTAIEDFLNENTHIGMMKINFIEEICILYPKSQINQKRSSIISKSMENYKINNMNFSDKLIENQLLISYINEYNLYNENFMDFDVEISQKEAIINDYKNKIRTQSNEITFKESQLNGIQSNLSLKDSQIKNIESKLVNKDRKINNLESQLREAKNILNSTNQEKENKNIEINKLTSDLKQKESEYDTQIHLLNNELHQKEQKLTENENKYEEQIKIKDNEINCLKNDFKQKNDNYTTAENRYIELIKIKENEINFSKNDLKQKESEYDAQIHLLNNELHQKEQKLTENENKYEEQIKIKDNEINCLKNDFKQKDVQIKTQLQELNKKNVKLESLEHAYTKQLSKIDNKEYCISCYKTEISNNHLEINYLKNSNLTKKLLSPLAYVYLILKSKLSDLSINIKLYNALKDSTCFDIGFYLNNNPDLIGSKWCKYFSPELHFVCNGFNEGRSFNKKYFNRNSKKELLQYILTCDK